MGFSIYDLRDSDLMAKLAAQGASGALAHELAEEFGLNGDKSHGVGIRLSWMRRFGMTSYDEKTHMWTLTPGAERVMEAKTRAAAAKRIETVPDEALVEVMSHVTTRWRLGDPMVADMLRREFQYGTSPRRR